MYVAVTFPMSLTTFSVGHASKDKLIFYASDSDKSLCSGTIIADKNNECMSLLLFSFSYTWSENEILFSDSNVWFSVSLPNFLYSDILKCDTFAFLSIFSY